MTGAAEFGVMTASLVGAGAGRTLTLRFSVEKSVLPSAFSTVMISIVSSVGDSCPETLPIPGKAISATVSAVAHMFVNIFPSFRSGHRESDSNE
jgi:ABC-type Fe3+-siderophore transport system permease subunit